MSVQGKDLNTTGCNESGNYHPILIKRPGSELLEDCNKLIWLQSRTGRFSWKVGGEGGAEEGKSRHRADSGKKGLVPLPGQLQQNELAEATVSYKASNGGGQEKTEN